MSNDAPERPASSNETLPSELISYTTTTAEVVENKDGDAFVKLTVPVLLWPVTHSGCTKEMAVGVLLRRMLTAASKAAMEFEGMGPGQVMREHGNLLKGLVRPVPPMNPPRPEGRQ